MFKNITLRQAQEYAQAIHKQWARLRGPYHSKECLIGALDGFYKGLGLPYAPQDGPYDFGTPEFDAYYLGEKLALAHLDYLEEIADDGDD